MNSILRRRRALMSQGEKDSTIYGNKLTWAVGNIDSTTGEINPSYLTYISSSFVKVDGEKVLTYTGPIEDENNTSFIVYAGQYDQNYNFISRVPIFVVSNHVITMQLVNNCKYVRFQYGHAVSTSVNMNTSDGSLFVCTVQDRSEVKNGFVDGTYNNGTSKASVANNILTLPVFNAAAANAITLNYKYRLNIQIGDTVRILIKRQSGSISGATNVDIYVGGNFIVQNRSWGSGETPIDITLTSPTDNSNLNFYIQNRSVNRTGTNYELSVTVYVNGVQVLPEV